MFTLTMFYKLQEIVKLNSWFPQLNQAKNISRSVHFLGDQGADNLRKNNNKKGLS